MPSSDPLPPKESAVFRKILKCYEMKQYKNGLKLAKQILSNPKFTEHGETLAMKGLTLNCLGRKDEAYEHVRRGLRNDLKSHVCWHVYGLLQRSDKKYDEAIKCYRNALKWEKDNIQILRDLSLLQIQMRDLEGYRETRHQLFKLRPSQHASWIGFAMSYHLLGDYETAMNILETFLSSQTMDTYDYKHSELLLYQNNVIQEAGNHEQALQHLKDCGAQILDKLAVQESMGALCLKLGRHEDAVTIYKGLIERNPDNTEYYRKLMEARKLSEPNELIEAYRAMQEEYPQSFSARRLPLDIATGDTFRALVDEHLRRNLRKGVPPLFVNLRSLYRDSAKVQTIGELVECYYQNLISSGYFSAEDAANPDVRKEPASALLWTMYYLAQHYDHLRESEKALDFINAAIEHTPTLIELFVTKGRIYKHAGDVLEAVKWLDEAQSLDTADRYINSKCAKYMLRANQIKEADEICAKFTREGVSAMENLNEMQCMWFQTECALAYQRLEKWGDALKKCHEIDRHFSEIIEDQFDFHTYCMRKMTLRSYVGLLRLEDVLRRHPFYFKAAKCAIEVYLRLFDKPLAAESAVEELDIENLPAPELKKLRNKQRKAQKKKAEQENAQSKENQKKEQYCRKQLYQDGDPEAPQLDELIPEKLARPDDPLEKAIEFLKPLQQLAKDNIETHLMAFEIYLRRNKLLLMLQSLKRARKIDANNAVLHSCIVRFYRALEQRLASPDNAVDPSVRVVIDRERENLFHGHPSAIALNDAYLAANRDNCDAVYEAAKIMYTLDEKRRDEAITLTASSTVLSQKVPLEKATKLFLLLKSGYFGPCEKHLKAFKLLCQKRYPLAVVFADVTATPITTLTTTQSSNADNTQTTVTDSGSSRCVVTATSEQTLGKQALADKPSKKQKNGPEIKAN
ncbi:N-alpha-acetyltransferase 15, NatA auxiliary subunit [Anopheles stephensi]|uniref:N-alpha-acetyltransferase 15, NatA auxiliary subunit n=1 Tax=Anopheles stephensi TaxID=30069 RepID=A0A182XVC6_ANOST|nr:N-alpha-acetyltransferase 15, NatA auxiliary subunit [Anopheles stephensi]XP_035892874.1 N-alpha-acetyltransferase 15, NatA auxiliary subunit [Anopheles stephensi]